MTREEFNALPLEDRLSFAERAAGVLVDELRKRRDQARKNSESNRKSAKVEYKLGNIWNALTLDHGATREAHLASEMDSILRRLHSWQAHPDTPAKDLPFPV